MTKVFSFQGSNKIVFGDGAVERLPELTKELRGGKLLVVMDCGLRQAGIADKVLATLEAAHVPFVLFDKVTSEPEPALADEAASLAKETSCDLVIGVGGGSSLDVAKAAAMVATNGGKTEDYIGLELVERPGLPTIMIPTTAGTGSEVTFTAVFTMRDRKKKGGINSRYLYPAVALLDPQLTLTLPRNATATTGMDALTHAIEAYTGMQSNPMSDLVAREAICRISANLVEAAQNGGNQDARREMLFGSLMGGLALASAGVGACHALAYPMGAVYDIAHGLANSILLPYVMAYNLESAPEKFAQIAAWTQQSGSSCCPASDHKITGAKGIEIIEMISAKIGIPKRLRDLGIPASAINAMAESAMTVARPIANNPRKMTKAGAVEIYEKAF